MILVFDSGGTKLDWRLIKSDGAIVQGREKGYHPLIQSPEDLQKIISGMENSITFSEVSDIYFYGAGCSGKAQSTTVSSEIKRFFPSAAIEVSSDLLGTARALCGTAPGIACILGTGANSCYYDGHKIIENVPPLGFILGDEGSGSYLGKALLVAYCRGYLPEKIEQAFLKRYEINKEEVPGNLMAQPAPNRWLAEFSRFVFHHRDDPVIYRLISDCFKDFLSIIANHYPTKDLPVHFSGSVAFYFNDFLRKVGSEMGLTIRNITESPIAGLALYHQQV